jgi:hypothetical protein
VSNKATAKAKLPKTTEKGAKTAGIIKVKFNMLAASLINKEDKLYFKADAPDLAKIPTDFVIKAGSHFIVTANNAKGAVEAVLDHVFSRPKIQGSSSLILTDNKETPSRIRPKPPCSRRPVLFRLRMWVLPLT